MATAKITLIGLNNYYGSKLWQYLTLPKYFDKDHVIDSILMKCGEFEVMYPDPNVLQTFIGVWCRKHMRLFERLAAAMEEEYLPLANYDRHEEWRDSSTATGTMSGTNSNTSNTETANDGRDVTSGSNSDETENMVSAFNASTYQARDKSVSTGTETSETLSSSGGTIESNSSGTQTAESRDTQNSDHRGHMYGNIGVTTTQQILLEEIRVSAISPYELIADMFSNEFSVKVYI